MLRLVGCLIDGRARVYMLGVEMDEDGADVVDLVVYVDPFSPIEQAGLFLGCLFEARPASGRLVFGCLRRSRWF